MTAYVALLRGVNVGGRGKLEMSKLKIAFEELGCEDVRTYINSGNVLFRDARSAKELTKLAGDTLGVRLTIRSLAQMKKLVASIPADWTNDQEQKTDVAFFLDITGAETFNAKRSEIEPGDSIVDVGDAVYTARNVNTVRKLTVLLSDM